MYSTDDFEQFDTLLEEMSMKIVGHIPGKQKCIKFTDCTLSDTTFANRINKSGKFRPRFLIKCIAAGDLEKFIIEYCTHKGFTIQVSETKLEHREMMKDYVLAKDVNFTLDKEPDYFLINDKDMISSLPAHHYISTMEIENPDRHAAPYIREYAPRSPHGITAKTVLSGETLDHINSYIPPSWLSFKGEVPDELPPEIDLLFKQIKNPMDRKFFLHWIYQSLTSRAQVYLILQGDPAVGKNRIKAVIKALHGSHNTVDGKKNSLTGNFNSQLANNTYVHFDEMKYTVDEENIMKEIPNGSIAIEEKFKDTTRSTRIYCSMIISNNKPRDNYIAFDARKFAPLTLSNKRLETVIPKSKIAEFSAKIDFDDAPTYDIAYIAQIGRWILKHGNSEKEFPQGEYRGPKFWELAHSSMFTWQKAIVKVLTQIEMHSKVPAQHIKALADGKLLYSQAQNIATKSKNLKIRDSDFPGDYTSAFYFLTIFRGLNGEKIFEVEPTDDHIYGDFTIKLLEQTPAEDLL